MALMKSYEVEVFEEKLVFQNAYIKLSKVYGNKNNLIGEVEIYKDESKEVLISQKSYEFSPDTNDDSIRWDKQFYVFLKTLDEFNDAIDV